MKKNWWNILITVFVFKHHRGGTKFWIQYMNWSMFLPRNKRILKNKLKNQIFLIVKGGANWSANWQYWISISKAPGALIGANTVISGLRDLDWGSRSRIDDLMPVKTDFWSVKSDIVQWGLITDQSDLRVLILHLRGLIFAWFEAWGGNLRS